MIQRMRNRVTVEVPEIDLYDVSGLEVTIEQKSSGEEFTYSNDAVEVAGEHVLVVTVPKADAMRLDPKPVSAQVMFTRSDGMPDATEPFKISVAELLKEDGYGD